MKGYTLYKFYSRQDEVVKFEELIKQASKQKNWELENYFYKCLVELKSWQKQNILANWQFLVIKWLSTDDPAKRLELCQRFGIVSTIIDDQNRTKFLTQKKDLRGSITKAKEVRFWTYWRDDAKCAYCSKLLDKTTGQIDHIIPISAWPIEFMFLAEDISNLVSSCQSCNRQKLNFLELPKKAVLHVEFNTCLPKQHLVNEFCPDNETETCDICGLPAIQVLCNVHGSITMKLCKLTALSEYLGHK